VYEEIQILFINCVIYL